MPDHAGVPAAADAQTPDAAGPDVPGPDAAEASNLVRWAAVLDELEAELAAAAAPPAGSGGRQAVAAWTAPRDLGPIPPALVDRATRLAAAQQEAIAALRVRARANRKQSAYLEAVPKTSGRDISIYLDVNG